MSVDFFRMSKGPALGIFLAEVLLLVGFIAPAIVMGVFALLTEAAIRGTEKGAY
jgi:hypothetical protein